MKGNLSTLSRYPAHQAFVVQLAQSGPEETDVPLGRAEHLVSGETTHFTSWVELTAFIERVLAEMGEKPP